MRKLLWRIRLLWFQCRHAGCPITAYTDSKGLKRLWCHWHGRSGD